MPGEPDLRDPALLLDDAVKLRIHLRAYDLGQRDLCRNLLGLPGHLELRDVVAHLQAGAEQRLARRAR